METRFSFVTNYNNDGYVLVARAYTDDGITIASETYVNISYDECVVKQQEFYDMYKTAA